MYVEEAHHFRFMCARVIQRETVFLPLIIVCCVTLRIILMMNGAITHAAG